MGGSETLQLPLRRQRLEHRDGFAVWAPYVETVAWKAAETALVLCDVWNHHTCRGAEVRLERLIPRMAAVVQTLRGRGVLIVHAPSNTMDFYAGTPARERVLEATPVAPRRIWSGTTRRCRSTPKTGAATPSPTTSTPATSGACLTPGRGSTPGSRSTRRRT